MGKTSGASLGVVQTGHKGKPMAQEQALDMRPLCMPPLCVQACVGSLGLG